ncbi:MAG TPA: 3-hydroxyacyl-CoA dehydrogenase NAD-binding domain-containing protein [Nitrolancea sp.]|nr:3-hydroxyacyl-CoA dehydrogenase NAD-binding domain-containing protein [Nitrolancea sp.]
MEITRIAVIGAGTMGAGIVQVMAQAGILVTMIDRDEEILNRSRDNIEGNLKRAVERNRISQDDAAIALSIVDLDTDIRAAGDVDLIVEAVPEVLSLKTSVFRSMDEFAPPRAILASNTSSISITRLAAETKRPGNVVGMHFFNPVPVMTLVEVVSGLQSSQSSVQAVVDLALRVGKTPVVVQDSPGFVSNRVLMPMINEAIFCLMEGVSSRDEIDQVMKLGMNHPMGPLALADLIGLDVCLDILEVLQRDFGDPKYRPCPLLRKMVAAGQLGRKSGTGFYAY